MLATSTTTGSVERRRQTRDIGEDRGEREVRTRGNQLPQEKEREVTEHIHRPCIWCTLVFNGKPEEEHLNVVDRE